MSLSFDVFVVDPQPIPSAVPGFEDAVGQATWPPSTSTLIRDDGGALLVDCLITEQEGRDLAAWVKSHGTEPDYVYITHPHGDHLLGLPEILAAFPGARPVALAESIPAMEEQITPGWMQIWGGFFPGQLTSKPVAPGPLAGTTIPIGGPAAVVIPVGTTDTGHSTVVHVAGLSLVVSGDAVYNQTHMWMMGSTPDSRASWTRALDAVAELVAGAGRGRRAGRRYPHCRPPQPAGTRRRRSPPDRRKPPLHRRFRGSAGTQLHPGRAHRPDDHRLPQPGEPLHPLGRGLRPAWHQDLTKRGRSAESNTVAEILALRAPRARFERATYCLGGHSPDVAGRGRVWPDVAFSCTDSGWTWPGVAQCLPTLAPRLAPQESR
jgi:glyoxylase-like metal-dependent hydrolase (beta-lactamase superfamily II)